MPDEDPVDAPAPPDPPAEAKVDAPDPEVAAAATSGKRIRLIALGVILAVVAILVIGIVRSDRRSAGDAPVVTGDAGAAVQAPQRPALPGDPSHPRLTGIVVDGTNTPVVGALVTAELEKGAVDRALATTPATGSAGTGSALGPGGIVLPVDLGWSDVGSYRSLLESQAGRAPETSGPESCPRTSSPVAAVCWQQTGRSRAGPAGSWPAGPRSPRPRSAAPRRS